jgi:putative ATP-dependent endonuclease of OLD family
LRSVGSAERLANEFTLEVSLPMKPNRTDMSGPRTVLSSPTRVRVLIVVEGTTDVAFLQNLSTILAQHDERLPNLAERTASGDVVFLPFGGGNVAAWRDRLAPLRIAEFHLYDGELPPETAVRQQAAAMVSARPNCRAAATSKRSLENYLHPDAIRAAGGPSVTIGPADDVGLAVAEAHHRLHYRADWLSLRRRHRRALIHKTKRWLANVAVCHMTPAWLNEVDPAGEVRSWFLAIRELGRFASFR